METTKRRQSKISNTLKIAGFCLFTAFTPLLLVSCAVPMYVSSGPETVQLPDWAPMYDNVNDVHYYYIPDIQAYYDVYRQEFVYMEDGYWHFSAFLPGYYANFNINNAYVVVLNSYVHEPWRHHEEYASHYPRYYYQSYGYNQGSRGYNENSKAVIYNSRTNVGSNNATPRNGSYNNNTNSNGTRNSPRINEPANNNGNNGNSGFNGNTRNSQVKSGAYAPAVQEPSHIRNEYPIKHESVNGRREGSADKANRTAPVEYKGRNVGQPVKVTKDMKAPKDTKTPKAKEENRKH